MSKVKNLLVWTLGGIILASAVGYVAMEYADDSNSFALGFVSCLLIGVIVTLIFRTTDNRQRSRFVTTPIQKLVTVSLILLAGLVASFVLFKLNEITDEQKRLFEQEELRQIAMIDAARNSGNTTLISQLIEVIDTELSNSTDRSLSNTTIDRIAKLSSTFEPYRVIKNDSLSSRELSPERGRLFLMLTAMDIDTATLQNIFIRTSFNNADLEGKDLNGLFLKNAQLKSANLRDANLQGSDLRHATLTGADMWGVNLNNAKCHDADFRRTDLRWATMNDAHCTRVNFNSADLRSAKLRRTDLRDTEMKYAFVQGAFLNNSDMRGTNLFDAHLNRAHLSGANLSKADIRRAIFIECDLTNTDMTDSRLKGANFRRADLKGAILDNASVGDENWLDLLAQNMVGGASEIVQKYQLIADTTNSNYFIIRDGSSVH